MPSALLLAGLCAATLNGPPARADAGCPAGINKLRYDNDIACFRDPTDRESPLDALKFVPLDEMGEIYLSLGGEIRQRYEYTHYPAFGEDPQDQAGVWLQRHVLHGDLQLGPHVRVFGELFSALEAGRKNEIGRAHV